MLNTLFFSITASLLVAASTMARADSSPPQPIIDVHIHASNEKSDLMHSDLHSVLQQMKQFNVVMAVVSGADKTLALSWKDAAPHRFIVGPSFPCSGGNYPRMYPCFPQTEGWPEITWLEQAYKTGQMGVMGELLHVYYGISPTDERLLPYFKLANKYAVPIAFHAADGPPKRARKPGCCPNFDDSMADPLLLKSVLDTFPNLRVYLMHGGEVTYHQQAIALMKAYPNVYTDLSILNSVYPKALHEKLLRSFIDAGLEDRIMFGSDNMPLGAIIERLSSFSFLSHHQKRKIFYENAARFFRLDERTIANHYRQ